MSKARVRKMGKPKVETIKAWSFSRWDTYTSCPRRAYYSCIEKIKIAPNRAMKRGSEIHTAAEQFIKREIDVVHPDLENFTDMLTELREAAHVSVEADWCFDISWHPTGWFDSDAWCRARVDVAQWVPSNSELTISDWKTGKPYPPKHEKQMELYGLVGLIKYPEAEQVTVEMVYTDKGEIHDLFFTQADVPRLKAMWAQRTEAMLTDIEFTATPSENACRFCDFAKSKGGPCEEEYKKS